MTNKILYRQKGYHISIISWENDADLYSTQCIVVNDIKYVHAINNFLQWLISRGIINTLYDDDTKSKEEEIESYLQNNILYTDFKQGIVFKDILSNFYHDIKQFSLGLLDILLGYGSGEWFCRVPEELQCIYIDEDIYCEEILTYKRR